MDDLRKAAYRNLLYRAMLDIRPIAWMDFRNPLCWRHNLARVRAAGEIANWLHNLASFAASDFDHFSEEWFWRDYEELLRRRPLMRPTLAFYRSEFDGGLAAGAVDRAHRQ